MGEQGFHKPNFQEQFSIETARQHVSLALAQELCALRDQWVSSNPYNEQNRWGALYGLLSPEEMVRKHETDPYSRLITATSKNGELAGYVRYRLPENPGGSAEIVLIAIGKDHLKRDRLESQPSLSEMLMDTTLTEMQRQGATSVVADICCSPIPNEASLKFHSAFGFKYESEGTPIYRNFQGVGDVKISFSRYRKSLQTELA